MESMNFKGLSEAGEVGGLLPQTVVLVNIVKVGSKFICVNKLLSSTTII